ncbi:unnamed protein product [Alternaria alternata]
MRMGSEACDFFIVGRVFEMLYVMTVGENLDASVELDAYTGARFGAHANFSIRGFVVVQVMRGFVYTCCITTFGEQGVMRPGCTPSEYTILYLQGTDPSHYYVPGEYESGMIKEPMALIPANLGIHVHHRSRIRLSKLYPIEMNVKVKAIGKIHGDQLEMLLWYTLQVDQYAQQVPFAESQFRQGILKSSPSPGPDSRTEEVAQPHISFQSHLSTLGLDNQIEGELYSDYKIINNPRSFFKKGVVFMVPWPEPSGNFVKDQIGPPVLLKIKRFVVIKPKSTFCLCLSIHTYGGQGTTKPGVAAQDHAAVIPEHGQVHYLPQEVELVKKPLSLRVENSSTGPIHRAARINFAKIYTVEYNVKVRKVGRMVADSVWHMDQYFAEMF